MPDAEYPRFASPRLASPRLAPPNPAPPSLASARCMSALACTANSASRCCARGGVCGAWVALARYVRPCLRSREQGGRRYRTERDRRSVSCLVYVGFALVPRISGQSFVCECAAILIPNNGGAEQVSSRVKHSTFINYIILYCGTDLLLLDAQNVENRPARHRSPLATPRGIFGDLGLVGKGNEHIV